MLSKEIQIKKSISGSNLKPMVKEDKTVAANSVKHLMQSRPSLRTVSVQEITTEKLDDHSKDITVPTKRKPHPISKSTVQHTDTENQLTGASINNKTFDVPIYTTVDVESALDDLRKTAKTLIMPGDKKTAYIIKTPSGYALNEKGSSFSWLCSLFEIVKKLRSKNGEMQVVLHIEDEIGSHDVTVSADIFSSLNLRNLSKYGIYYSPEYELAVSMYFQQVLAKMPMHSSEQKLGFTQDNGKLRFIGYDDRQFQTQCEYDSYEDYIDALNDLIDGNTALQYLICATMAAALMTVLRFKFRLDLHSYIINVVGSSSTGKTTASRLCASMWTDPLSKMIFAPMNSTTNAFYKTLDGIFGIPIFRDEGGITGNINKEEIGYTVYEECEKARLKADCSLRESGAWNTVMVITGEEHFNDMSHSQNGGQVVRIHNADNLAFTKDSNHADKISSFATHNYGVIGKLFVDKLLHIPDEELKEDYDSALDIMHSMTYRERSEYTPRLCGHYAVTYQAARILQTMGLDIFPDEIAGVMAQQNASVFHEYNRTENAMQAIREYVMAHLADTGIRTFPNGSGYASVQSVAITVGLTRTILEDAGFKDVSIILKELDRKGCLIRQGNGNRNGLVSNLTIRGVQTRCYQFILSDGTLNEAEN